MIWFDYIALGVLAYFIIRGFLSGFIKTFFSFIGMIVAFLYSGWLSIKISPFIGKLIINNPKVLPILSLIIAFIIIYLFFILLGILIRAFLGTLNLTVVDYVLGGIFGVIKGVLFITLFYIILVLPYPQAQKYLSKALTYPIVKYTWKTSSQFLPKNWINFLKKHHIEIN